ncbi:MAG: hypothetical protein RLZZ50_1300 [Verrucomicrobiota bacterium]
MPPRIAQVLLIVFLIISRAQAQPFQPGNISVVTANDSGSVALSWTTAENATGYVVRRSSSTGGDSTILAASLPSSATTFVDSTAQAGVHYLYTVGSLGAGGESPGARGVWASPALLLDNATAGNVAPGVSFNGNWATSSVNGSFGNLALFAGAVSGSTPTATYTFTPTLPARGLYDIYLRWTAHSNRATNTPVDVIFPDGNRTFTVNQQLNGGAWNYLTTISTEAGTDASLTVRNNGANGNVVVDGIQFVPRLAPWAPAADAPQDYTLLSIEENFDGSSLNQSLWSTFAGRSAYVVSGGNLRTRLQYIGAVPLASATTADLENEANWNQGGIIADQAQKFGYHEARLRLPPAAARGVDTAYWHAATDEYIHGYEIDAPEFFNKDTSGVQNNFGFGNWDHFLPTIQRINPDTGKLLSPGRTWDYDRKTAATFGDLSQYITIGLEWRTDNTQVVYLNGQNVYTAPASGMNDIESILPAQIILSTKVLDWLRPNAALNGAETLWDYVRYYQKPGFIGAADGDWTKPANWGPDGLPGAGVTAVFNLPAAPAAISLPTDQSPQTLYLEGASLPAHVFSGPGKLLLGSAKAGDDSVTHGGILVNTNVSANQTFQTDIVGLQNLQFANLSRTAGVVLRLNGLISGDGVAPRDVDFLSSLATNTSMGAIVLGQPLGSGLRHINRAGDSLFTLPAGNQHTGELRIARGPVSISNMSALGLTANATLEFGPRYQHSDNWRPRLIYNGPAATSARPIRMTNWGMDGMLESSGTGPLTWDGDVVIVPVSQSNNTELRNDARLTLGGSYAAADNVFNGSISDEGMDGYVIPYTGTDGTRQLRPALFDLIKTGASTWVLAGPVSVSDNISISGGKLFVGRGVAAPFAAPSVSVAAGAEFGFGADTDASFGSPISGAGGFRKRGAGTLTLTGNHTYSGPTSLDAGALVLAGSLASTVTTAAGTTISGNATISGGLSISGTFAPRAFSVGSSLNLRATSALRASFNANNANSIGSVSAPVLAITSGARVDITLNDSGSTANFIQTYWRTARSFPLITCGSRSGTLTLGTVSADSAGNTAATYGSFSLQHTAGGVNLLWTPLPGFPDVDAPSVTLFSPVASPASGPLTLADTASALRLVAAVGGGSTTTLAWTQVSGPGIATFANAGSADTAVAFSAAGSYVLRATASNALGSVSLDLAVLVAPPTSIALRQGVNGYSHAATFIRADTTTWNSGARDQMLVGKNSAMLRTLVGFDVSAAPAGAAVSSATLDVWTDAVGSGSVSDIELRPLLRSFVEGTGNGSTASNGVGTGADWTTFDGATSWTAAGGDIGSAILATIAGFPSSQTQTQKTFASSPAFVSAVQSAVSGSTPLNLALVSPLTEAGANNNFVRFATDENTTVARRPLLTLTLSYPLVPSTNPGVAPSATVNQAARLLGGVSNATSSLWSLVSGPGAAVFADAAAPVTTVTFSAAGAYVLRLSATNSLGESFRTLSVNVATPPLTPLESWRLANFGSPANSGNAADTADPDGDGLLNLIEFALGSNPNSAASAPAPTVSTDVATSTLRLDYVRAVSALNAVTLVAEWTASLATQPVVWSASGVTSTVLSDNGTLQQVRASMPLPASGARFLRLRVTNP